MAALLLLQLPGAVQVFGTATGPVAVAASSAMSVQATRHARRIYVGGLPPSALENNIMTFFRCVGLGLHGPPAAPPMPPRQGTRWDNS